MALLIAGSAARGGAALASGLARRGREVTLAGRFDLPAEAAAAEWLASRVRVEEVRLQEAPSAGSLRDAVAFASGIVIVGDASDRAFDLDLTFALADAACASQHRPPIVRLAAMSPSAGAEAETVVLRDGRARLRDFPAGVPEERSAAAVEEADRALLEFASTRDLPAAVVRFAELVAPGRFAFSASDVVCRAVLAGALGAEQGLAMDAASTIDVIDGWSLSKAAEAALERIEALAGEVMHVAGGRNARVAIGDVDDPMEPVVRTGPVCAWLLDDERTRALTGAQPITHARTAIERFRRFALAHRERLVELLAREPALLPRTL